MGKSQEEIPEENPRVDENTDGGNSGFGGMRVEFPFIKEKAEVVPYILRPYAKVIFNEKIPEWLYVDSGADITLLPKKFGEFLGFKLKEGEEIKEIRGIGGSKVPYVIRRVNMRIGKKGFKARVAWSLTEDVPLVLGRLDIFNKCDVLFREGDEKVIFIW